LNHKKMKTRGSLNLLMLPLTVQRNSCKTRSKIYSLIGISAPVRPECRSRTNIVFHLHKDFESKENDFSSCAEKNAIVGFNGHRYD
jgi:hypothetical protein